MQTILICDDDREIVEAVSIYLAKAGYQTRKAYTGREALAAVEREGAGIHLAILDVMMPEMDGILATRLIRRQSNLPILMLTAKSEERDKVAGLDTGADDYLTKPFSSQELCARVRSLLRRYTQLGSRADVPTRHEFLGLAVDEESRSVTLDGEPVSLTPSEYGILLLLIQNRGKVLSSSQIYESVWGETALGCENVVSVHIRHIREKIEINPREPRYVKVLWGQGYRIG